MNKNFVYQVVNNKKVITGIISAFMFVSYVSWFSFSSDTKGCSFPYFISPTYRRNEIWSEKLKHYTIQFLTKVYE